MTIAVIKVRSTISANKDVIDTLKMLNLHHINNCTLIHSTESYQGMLQKTKDYITWGEIDDNTLKQLLSIKSITLKGKLDTAIKELNDQKKKLREITNPTIKLHPPRKGYEGIKKPYSMGGSLGYRGSKINELLVRMIP